VYSCQAKGAGVLARPQGRTEYLRRVPVVVNARAVRPQQVVIAQTSKHTRTRARTHAHISARTRTCRRQGTAGRGARPPRRRTRRTRIPPHTPPSGAVGDSVGDAERRVPARAQHGCAPNSPWTRSRPCAMAAARMLATVGLFVRFLACLCCRRGGGRGAPRRPSRPADRPADVAALALPVTVQEEGSDPTPPWRASANL
jgi:hypothetical protein